MPNCTYRMIGVCSSSTEVHPILLEPCWTVFSSKVKTTNKMLASSLEQIFFLLCFLYIYIYNKKLPVFIFVWLR